jgi:glycosyltransferase involved in cell wall biosynthesis
MRDTDAGVAAKLAAGLDLSRRDYAAEEFIELPPAQFIAQAYAACFGHPPAPELFAALRDRLLAGESRVRLLREWVKSGHGVSMAGLPAAAWREAMAGSAAADFFLKGARLGRDISRLPRNLRRKLAPRLPASPPESIWPTARAGGGKPRIAVLSVAAGERGGAERFYGGLCGALNQAGMEAELVARDAQEGSFAEVAESYRRFENLDLSAYDGVISSKAPTYAVRHPNHVCYLMHTMRGWYDMFEASHPFASQQTQKERAQIQALDTAILQAIPQRLAIGEEVAQRLRAYNGLDATVLHLPSTLTGLREGPFRHLFLPGRLHPWKRVELAIAAMRFVKAPLQLVIVGTGQEELRLRALAKPDPRIVFTGFVSEAQLAGLYAEAAAVLLLPKREDLGLVTFEAFACGKPVITCTDSGEPARLAQDGQSGFVCTPDAQAIAEKIEALAGDPARAAAMGHAGQMSVADITWEKGAATLIVALGLQA